jgi:acetyl esterase/lipase
MKIKSINLIIFLCLSCCAVVTAQQKTSNQTTDKSDKSSIQPKRQENQTSTNKAVSQPRRSFAEMVNMPVVYKLPGMEKVTVKKDLNYKGDKGNELLKMDVYPPPGLAKGEKRPAVIFIHGGAGAEFKPKDWGIYVSWGKLIAASGLVGVTFTHRLGFPKTLVNESAADVTDAIDYVLMNADVLGVDKDRICLAAYSAGGPMLSLGMRDKPPFVRCLVGFYSFMDIHQSSHHRESESNETLDKFSPINYLDENASRLPPIFIARAGRDEIPTLNDSIDRFIREAITKNAPIDFANHPEGVHGFDNQNDDERSKEIIKRVIEFMKTHLYAK